MKVIGFAQLRNELWKGNLQNWFRCMEFCDFIYIYDQNSNDGSKEYYKNFDNTFVIESSTNDFYKEIACKKILLEKLLKEHPDVDWIFWMDGDTVLDGRMLRNNGREFKLVLQKALKEEIDVITMGHLNLWRSDIHYRIDNDYDWLHNNGVKVFWRNNGKIHFPDSSGLHQPQYPIGLKKQIRINRNLIHRGFATDKQITSRYELYKSKGQTGNSLERLLDETTLKVEEIDKTQLPDWFETSLDDNPINLKRLKE